MTGLIVAGFHRSGTSSVAQMLDSYGISLGDELMAGNEFNKFGHFESWPVVRFHDEVLGRIGADWSTPLNEPITLTDLERQWVRTYVEKRETDSGDWALKDPRMCRFMLQWKDVAPKLKFLIVYRSAADSCQSLNRRSNLLMARSADTDAISRRFYNEPDLALRLWIEHNRELIALQKAFPEDCMVLGHHHILAGFPIVPAMEDQFGIKPAKTPERATIDPEALSKKTPNLHVKSQELIEEAVQVWRALEAEDVAVAEGRPGMSIAPTLTHDPTGNHARAEMAELQLSELYRQLAQYRQAIPLIRKASKRPFSFYFMNKKKYRNIIEKVLNS
ncbi:hypothetical protein FGK63_08035 [Ruegeria sediminis]|uniref:Sulfotransferase family protein n=1 Tax=Ruegeria sediminis TaxID=2583820 RepID=A0ABY2X2I2_9RHOB|nr:hypothetical protein [Ruegeria sediminis]TMV09058.1 hypothetical protein FGK63_08035 [Ruegeria sediminis]